MEPTNRILKWQAFPCPELHPHVDRYWAWENSGLKAPMRFRMLPGTGKELVFHYLNPFCMEHDDGTLVELPQTHLICLRNETAMLRTQLRTGFISIRFRAGGFRHFCRESAAELADTFVDMCDVDSGFHSLSMQIMEAESFQERVGMIESRLIKLLHVATARDHCIDHAVNSLYYEHAEICPSTVCKHIGMGLRQFQRSFKTAMGMGPKRFIRLSRFQHTVKSLLLNGTDDMIYTALKHGFYDQSHFIRDFKELAGQTPYAFLETQKTMTHFYNTSRPTMGIIQPSTT